MENRIIVSTIVVNLHIDICLMNTVIFEGPFTIKVKSTFNESKQLLKQAFTSHDVVMKGNKSFSITLLSSLVIIGLLILGMLLHLLSASLFDGYFVDTATIILKFVLTTMLALAFLFIVTFAVIRLMIVESISFKRFYLIIY